MIIIELPRPILVTGLFLGKVHTKSTSLVAAPRNIWIFISRLEPSVTQDAVGAFVGGLCEGSKVVIEKLQTRFETYASFKEGLPMQYSSILEQSEIWPEGVIVSRYQSKRNSRSTYEQKNS